MAKKSTVSPNRDQRSLDAAREGTRVTLRLALLRHLDRRPPRATADPRRLSRSLRLIAVTVVALNHQEIITAIWALVGR